MRQDMKMTVQEIEQVSRSVASEYHDLSIVGVTAADGEADHAELLIEMCACDDEESCMVQINVPRGDREGMEQALRSGFESAIAERGHDTFVQ